VCEPWNICPGPGKKHIYVVLKHFIFPNRTVLVRLYRRINDHHVTEYAASSNTRNQIISSEQTWQLYTTQSGPGSSVGIATDYGLDGP